MNKKRYLAFLILILSAVILAGCNIGKKDEAEKDSEKDIVSELGSNEDESSNLGKWGRAMGAVLTQMNGGNPYYFGGYEATDANRSAAKSILEQSWQIENRKQLLKQIKKLVNKGHRKEYKKEAKEMNKFSETELQEILNELTDTMRLHYENVQYNYDKWEMKGVMAWDWCRVSHLAQWGYLAGYLTVSEAQAVIEPAALQLKENFTSWEDVQNNWLDGYVWWADIDRSQTDNDYEKRKAVYEKLVEEQGEKGVLFDDTLFTKDIVPLTYLSYESLFDEVKSKKAKATPTPEMIDTDGDGVPDATASPDPDATASPDPDAADTSEEETDMSEEASPSPEM